MVCESALAVLVSEFHIFRRQVNHNITTITKTSLHPFKSFKMMVSRVTRYHPATPRKNDTPRKIKSPIPKSRDALKSSIKKSSNEQKSKDEGKPAKKRVSIGGIFKQPIVKETTPRRSRRQKRVVQEHDLFLDYQGKLLS